MSNKVKFDIFANDKTTQAFNKVQGHLDNIGSSIKKIGMVATAVAAGGLAAIAAGISKVTSYANIQEDAEAKLAAVLKATHEAAGFTLEDLKKMASGFQDVTTYGDETILSGMSVLSTFKKIGHDAFPRAVQAALDMSKVLGQDLKNSMIQVGRSLNDPTKNLTLLTRLGISFTKSEMDQIKALQQSGNLMKAQDIILDKLSGKFGGAATAAAKTFGGATDQLKNKFGDLMESLGYVITKNQYFIDLVKSGVGIVGNWIEKIDRWRQENQDLIADKFDQYFWDIHDAVEQNIPVFQKIWQAIKVVADVIIDATRAAKDFINWLKQGLSWVDNLMSKLEAFETKVHNALPSWMQLDGGTSDSMQNTIDQMRANWGMGPLAGSGSSVQQYASGTGLAGLPSDGLFYGHQGEIVKTKSESNAERSGRNGAGTVNNYISVSPQFMTGDRNAARSVAREIQRMLTQQGIRWGTA